MALLGVSDDAQMAAATALLERTRALDERRMDHLAALIASKIARVLR